MTETDLVTAKAAHDYLTKYYSGVAGFSSLFSAEVAAVLLSYQNEVTIAGSIGEIGVMKGRSFIGLALHSKPDDICLAIDRFDWPANVYNLFVENCQKYGVDWERVIPVISNTQDLKAADILAHAKGQPLRYLHIDGGHEPWILAHDLELANAVMAAGGIMCLDDMLHPMYPELPVIVHAFLAQHRDWAAFCIVDRADVIAASKYLLCRTEFVDRYQAILREKFARYAFVHPAEFAMSRALILTKDTALQGYYDTLIHL
jgi:predicted O-methyltransferase YrrM